MIVAAHWGMMACGVAFLFMLGVILGLSDAAGLVTQHPAAAVSKDLGLIAE